MDSCNFNRLVRLIEKKLSIDDKLKTLYHLDSCVICRDAVYQITRDRDEALFRYRPYVFERSKGLKDVA